MILFHHPPIKKMLQSNAAASGAARNIFTVDENTNIDIRLTNFRSQVFNWDARQYTEKNGAPTPEEIVSYAPQIRGEASPEREEQTRQKMDEVMVEFLGELPGKYIMMSGIKTRY